MSNINTYSTEEFLAAHMRKEPILHELVQPDPDTFFMAPVEEMISLSRLPVPPMRTTSHAFIFLRSGMASMKVGFRPVEIHENEVLCFPAMQVGSYEKYEVNTGFILTFEPGFLLGKYSSIELLRAFQFLKLWAHPVIKPDPVSARHIHHLLDRIYPLYQQSGLQHAPMIRANILAILHELSAAYTSPQGPLSDKASLLLQRFFDLIAQSKNRPRSVQEYAGLLHVSPGHLNKIIRTATGKPTSIWIQEALLLEAKMLLFQTDIPINEIARQLGFEDPSYFSRLFRKFEGIAPLAYRRQHR